MNVEVRLLASLDRYRPSGVAGRTFRLTVPDRVTTADLMSLLHIPTGSVRIVAVNGRHQPDPHFVLSDGDVVSLLPPLAGGSPARLGPFHVGPQEIDLPALRAVVADPAAGAIVTFEGVVRNNARGKTVTHLSYEAYEPMAEEVLAQIAREMTERWDLRGVAMSHRVGSLAVGEASIGIAVSAAHRKDAFAACAYAMDRIKEILPVWKKEFADDGASWVEGPGGNEGRRSGGEGRIS